MKDPTLDALTARPGLLIDDEVMAKMLVLRDSFGKDRETDGERLREIHAMAKRKGIEDFNARRDARDETNVVAFPGRLR